VSYVSRQVHTLAGCISGLDFSMQAVCQYGVQVPIHDGEGAASDSDLLESFASDILSDSFTYWRLHTRENIDYLSLFANCELQTNKFDL